jgi:hypothetical protein
MSARQGKIARLPAAIREELNLRLLDGQSGRVILRWLNAHPTVKKLLEEDAEGLLVTDANLSNWRLGGFEDWRRRREHVESLREMSRFSIDLAKASGGQLTEGAAAILSGKILEVLEGVQSLSREGAPPQEPAQVAALAESLCNLSDSLASLRTGDQNNRRLAQNDARLELLKGRLAQTQQALELEQKKFQRMTCELFQTWFNDDKVKEILAGSEADDAKTERLGQRLFGEEWR